MKPSQRRGSRILKKLFQIIGVILTVLVVMAAAGVVTLLIWSPGKTEPFLDETGNVKPESTAEIVKMDIGGVQQGMILRGQSSANPVLLFLHGGPGGPEYFIARNYPTGLEELFTVCWWDQRGAGMSFSPDIPPETMTLEQMISDTVEVTEYLRSRFGQEKIYLMSRSWGTLLGVYTVSRHPELFHAYIGIAQISDQFASEKAAYTYMLNTARETGDIELARKLEDFTLEGPETLTMQYNAVKAEGMMKQGIGGFHNKSSDKLKFPHNLFQTREYTFTEKIGYFQGGAFSHSSLWPQSISLNLMESHRDFSVPVYIFHGKYDYQVSYTLAKNYFQLIDAPLKGFYTFENSAHMPLMEEPEHFRRILAEDVLKNQTSLAD